MQTNFENEFAQLLYLEKTRKQTEKIIFLCIGTDRITGDCLGPLVGSNLKEIYNYNKNISVIGDVYHPIHAENVNKAIKEINQKNDQKIVITIDSALAQKQNIGEIHVQNTPLIMGRGLNKRNSIKIGNISIKGVVGQNYNARKYNFFSLQNVPLRRVMKIAEEITLGIYNTINV